MLVLSRREDESIFITVPGVEEPIVVTIVLLSGDKCRLGIQARNDISVDREEVYLSKMKEKRSNE